MKFATLIALVATINAEKGVVCDDTKVTDWTASADATITGAADAKACGEAATKLAEADKENDTCAHAATSGKVDAVVADDAATPPVVAADEVPAKTTCALWTKVTADEAQDIRVAKADDTTSSPTMAYEAWSWDAGVAMDALVAGADGDNAKMITSAIAAVATIAAVAF